MNCYYCTVILKDTTTTTCGYCEKNDPLKLIKHNCARCQVPLRRRIKRYINQGNLCKDCNTVYSKRVIFNEITKIQRDFLDRSDWAC